VGTVYLPLNREVFASVSAATFVFGGSTRLVLRMPDPSNPGQFLAAIPNLVKDWHVEYNNDDANSWATHERSAVGLAPAAHALFLCILAFATS
jgi:hypothetical protein